MRIRAVHNYYSSASILLASACVEEELPKQEDVNRFKALGKMVQHLAAIGHAAVLRGHFYEHFAHVYLCRGCNLPCRPLEEKAKKKAGNAIFVNVEEPQAPDGLKSLDAALKDAADDAYFDLSRQQKNFPAADAVAILNKEVVILQMTCADKHPIALKGLFDLVKVLVVRRPKQDRFRLFFVLPTQTRFEKFSKQAMKLSDSGALPGGITKDSMRQLIDEKVEQWALKLTTE